MKIDRRRHYILVLDTETANTITDEQGRLDMSNVLVYDCGWQVVDTHGTVYESASYVNRDIFVYERDLMQNAYYSSKIPLYVQEIQTGTRKMVNFFELRQALLETLKKWNIKEVAAHNARFDCIALNNTQRWVTKSKFRWFFPYGIEIWDTMKAAESVILKMPTYQKFCAKYGYLTKQGRPRKTAEILYRFISKNPDFQESHTALEDVQIEAQILAYCYKQHKKMRKKLWES